MNDDNSLPIEAMATGPRRGNELRLAKMKIDPRSFLAMCQGSFELIHPPLPSDLEMLGVHPEEGGLISLVLRSQSFDRVARPDLGLPVGEIYQEIDAVQIHQLSNGNARLPAIELETQRAMLNFNPAIFLFSMKSGCYEVVRGDLPLDTRIAGVGVSATAVHFDLLSRGFVAGQRTVPAPAFKLIGEYVREYQKEKGVQA